MDQRQPYPGVGHAVLMTLAALGLQLVLIIPIETFASIVALASDTPRFSPAGHPAMLGLLNIITLGAVIAWGVYRNGVPLREVLPLVPLPAKAVLALVVTTFGGVILLSEVDNLFRRVVPMPTFVFEMFDKLFHHPEHAWATFVLMVLIAPATEEPLFRGVILRGLLGHGGTIKAITVSAVLFGFLHLNPWQFVSASLLGLLFGWWYVRTRSLVPCLIGHAIVNGLVFGATAFPFQVRGFNDPGGFTEAQLQPLWFDALGVCLTIVGVWCFARWAPPAPSALPVVPPPAPPPPPLMASAPSTGSA